MFWCPYCVIQQEDTYLWEDDDERYFALLYDIFTCNLKFQYCELEEIILFLPMLFLVIHT